MAGGKAQRECLPKDCFPGSFKKPALPSDWVVWAVQKSCRLFAILLESADPLSVDANDVGDSAGSYLLRRGYH